MRRKRTRDFVFDIATRTNYLISGRNLYEANATKIIGPRPTLSRPADGCGVDVDDERRIYPGHPEYEKVKRQADWFARHATA
jgi:hypothetical protein